MVGCITLIKKQPAAAGAAVAAATGRGKRNRAAVAAAAAAAEEHAAAAGSEGTAMMVATDGEWCYGSAVAEATPPACITSAVPCCSWHA